INAWRADPLVWGHGPRIFEVFLEPTCPFSVKAFAKLEDLLDQAGEDRITIKVRLQSQPWPMYSGGPAAFTGRPATTAAVIGLRDVRSDNRRVLGADPTSGSLGPARGTSG